jgi:AcrR family transcriptional regulator
MPRPSKRDDLIDAAITLFNRDGFHATGIDGILDRAGVARMTLYNHFRSKDDLIVAAMVRRSAMFRRWYFERVRAVSEDPYKQLLALFDVLAEWIADTAPGPAFNGCFFINAAAEFGDRDSPAHRAAAAHKEGLRALVADIARSAGAGDADELAARLCQLIDGAIVTAQVGGADNVVARAKAMAIIVIDHDLGGQRG